MLATDARQKKSRIRSFLLIFWQGLPLVVDSGCCQLNMNFGGR
jgi:hypothetical protein